MGGHNGEKLEGCGKRKQNYSMQRLKASHKRGLQKKNPGHLRPGDVKQGSAPETQRGPRSRKKGVPQIGGKDFMGQNGWG